MQVRYSYDSQAVREEALATLARHRPAFAALTRPVRTLLLSLSRVRVAVRGTLLCEQGARPQAGWAVVDGEVAERAVDRSGIAREVRRAAPGDIAGLVGLLDQGPAPCDVETATHCQLLEIDVVRLAQLRAAFHPVAGELAATFTTDVVAQLHELERRARRLAAAKASGLQVLGPRGPSGGGVC